MENNSTKVKEFEFQKIEQKSKWEAFQTAIYDPSKQEFLGRTKKSWYKLLTFYSIFYICLAALFAICTRGLMGSLDDKVPKYVLKDSLIGTNPGLGFRPISSNTKEGSLIWYDVKDACTTTKWVKLLDNFLEPYQIEQVGGNYQSCSFENPPKEGNVCTVKIDETFGPCTPEKQYGYNSTSPCVFLKLNRIYGWVPDYITVGEDEMQNNLKTNIEDETKANKSYVWISCRGRQPYDRERIGDFQYFPKTGIPGYYFPYTNSPNYLSPLIAVQIMNVQPNAIVNIECRAWAKNIKYSGSHNDRKGSVAFELLVDDSRG